MADNCEPRKIDSNRTGLSFAETICGRLPTIEEDGRLPVWHELEPNSYDDFGGAPTLTSRRPINSSRQRKKGTITDQNAAGGINMDFTKSNFNRLLQGFFFADAHQKATTAPLNGDTVAITGAVASSKTYTAAAGLSHFRVGMLVLVEGFTNAANNGVKRVVSVSGTAIGVAEALTDEAGSEAVTIQCVGWQFATGGASITLNGALGQLTLAAAPAAASGTITLGAPVALDTVTIAGIEYTFVEDIDPDEPYSILLGNDAEETAANFAAAINGNVIGTDAHPLVSATSAEGVVTVTAKIKGTAGNAVTLATDTEEVTVSGANLTGGTGLSFYELGLLAGEWVYLGDDTTTGAFADNAGYGRIATITDTVIQFDKTTWVPAGEAGTGKDIRLWIGLTIRNEPDADDIVTRYYEFERTLGRDANGPQAEYLTKSVMNELTLNIPLPEGEDAKLNADLSWISGVATERTGAEGLKAGTRVGAPGEGAFNTASNVVRLRMSVLDPATSRPTPLFAYLTEGTLTINNNVSGVKAVGTLGNIDVSAGDFDAGGTFTALFRDVQAIRAARNNADVTCDFIAAANNAGFVFDIPLLTLGAGTLDVEPGEPVRLELEVAGAENPLGYTMLYTNWAYLPTAAMPLPETEY
jgi:hypothetical protein